MAFQRAGLLANDVPIHIYVCDVKYVDRPSEAAQVSSTLAGCAFWHKDSLCVDAVLVLVVWRFSSHCRFLCTLLLFLRFLFLLSLSLLRVSVLLGLL